MAAAPDPEQQVAAAAPPPPAPPTPAPSTPAPSPEPASRTNGSDAADPAQAPEPGSGEPTPIRPSARRASGTAAAGRSVLAAAPVVIHSCPASDCAALARVNQGDTLMVVEGVDAGGWVSVRVDGAALPGYVQTALLRAEPTSRTSGSRDGGTRRDCSTCPPMVLVAGRDADTLLLSRSPVTRANWWACVREGICPARGAPPAGASDDTVVVEMTSRDAQSYASWLSSKTGKTYLVADPATVRRAISTPSGDGGALTGGTVGFRVARPL